MLHYTEELALSVREAIGAGHPRRVRRRSLAWWAGWAFRIAVLLAFEVLAGIVLAAWLVRA